MEDLSQLSEVEVERLLEMLEVAIDAHPKGRISIDRSSRYENGPFVSTVKTHKIHDDSYVTIKINYV